MDGTFTANPKVLTKMLSATYITSIFWHNYTLSFQGKWLSLEFGSSLMVLKMINILKSSA
jgi:hypothetical protein